MSKTEAEMEKSMSRFIEKQFNILEVYINSYPMTIVKEYFPEHQDLGQNRDISINQTASVLFYQGHNLHGKITGQTKSDFNPVKKDAIGFLAICPEGPAPQATGMFATSLYISQLICPADLVDYILDSLITAYHNAAINGDVRYLYFNSQSAKNLIQRAKSRGWTFTNDSYLNDVDSIQPPAPTVLANMLAVETIHSH
jgi:hypothetical protein